MLSEKHIPQPRKSCGTRHIAPRLIKLSYVAPPFVLNKEHYEAEETKLPLICVKRILQLKLGILLGSNLPRNGIQAGKLTALAVADETRSPQLPAVPTTAESGFATLQATFWAGVVAPAGTSPTIVSKLNAAINEILKSPELEANLAKISARPKIGSPEDFASFMAAETQKWMKVASSAGIRAD